MNKELIARFEEAAERDGLLLTWSANQVVRRYLWDQTEWRWLGFLMAFASGERGDTFEEWFARWWSKQNLGNGEEGRCRSLTSHVWQAAIASMQAAQPPAAEGADADFQAVNEFAEAMRQKMLAARNKGRSGWQEMDPAELSRMLREHVEKGDPRDVANFCMMLWHLNSPIAAPASSASE